MRKLLVAFVGIVGLLGYSSTSAGAYSWNYVGSSNIAGTYNAGSGGGLFYRDGHYFYITVGHVIDDPGTVEYQYHPEFGYLGSSAYRSSGSEIGLVDLGTSPLYPLLRLGNNPNGETVFGIHLNQIVSISQAGDVAPGTYVCQSGWNDFTQQVGGYRCGQAGDYTGPEGPNQRQYLNTIDGYGVAGGGDSGGPVWQPLPNGTVRLVGHVTSCGGTCSWALFTRVSQISTHVWGSVSGDKVAPGFNAAPGGYVVTGT